MSWKDTNITNPGTSIRYGADDMEVVSRLFNGVTTGVPAVTIKSTNKWGFWDAILYFRNQADTKNITIRGPTSSPATDIDLTLPPSTANDTLASLGLAQTFALKQTLTSGAVFTQMSSPSNPGSSKHHLFVASNGHLMKRDNAGLETDYNLTAPVVPITMEAGTLALRNVTRVFKVTSTYYAVRGDGTIASSGSNPNTVIQAALNETGDVYLEGQNVGSDWTWDLQAGFTGFLVSSYTHIHLGKTTNINAPNGYTGSFFKIVGDVQEAKITGYGGYLNEQGVVARNWTGVQIGEGLSSDSITNIEISGIYIYQPGTGISINQGSTGSIRLITIDNVEETEFKKAIQWIAVSDVTKVKDITVSNMKCIAHGTQTTDGYKDVKGTRIQFFANQFNNFTGSMNEMNVASGAVNTMVWGGNHTGVVGTFTDAGTDTYIDDATHTEFKLKGTAITGSAIGSDQNNYAPTGWDEKQNVLRISATGSTRTITGLVCGSNPKNRVVRILNVGSIDIVLASENASSSAANRFKFQTNITMMANQSVTLFYDTVDSRWRAFSDAMAGHAMLTMANTFLEPITIKKDASDLLFLYRPNSTNGITQDLDFDFNDSIGTQLTYCDLRATVVDSTDGSEDGMFQINLMNAGTKNKYFEFQNDGSLRLYSNVSTVGNNTQLLFQGRDSVGNQQDYAVIRSEIVDNTSASEDGKLEFGVVENGSFVEEMILSEATLDLLKGQLNITRDASPTLLDLYRTDNSVGNGIDVNFYLQDSGAAKQLYTNIRSEILDATAGSEDAYFQITNVWNGALAVCQELHRDGNINLIRQSSTANDEWSLVFSALSSTSVKRDYAKIYGKIITNTNAAEDGEIRMTQLNGGSAICTHKFLNNGKIQIGRDGSVFRGVSSYINTTSDDVRFVNSSVENTMLSFTVKGGVMGVDGHVIVKGHGYYLQNSATGTNYTWRIKVGGTTVWQQAVGGSQAQSANTKPWIFELRFLPSNQSTTSGRMVGFLMLNDTAVPTTGQGDIADDEIQASGPIRATGISWTFANDTTISITVQMDQAQAAAEWQMDGYTVEYAPS